MCAKHHCSWFVCARHTFCLWRPGRSGAVGRRRLWLVVVVVAGSRLQQTASAFPPRAHWSSSSSLLVLVLLLLPPPSLLVLLSHTHLQQRRRRHRRSFYPRRFPRTLALPGRPGELLGSSKCISLAPPLLLLLHTLLPAIITLRCSSARCKFAPSDQNKPSKIIIIYFISHSRL